MSQLLRVFVYGTLKRGEPNHGWIKDQSKGFSKFLFEAKTEEKYPLVIATSYNIPFLLNVPGEGHNVEGEVYEVDTSMLQHLDVLEDHPNFYERELRYMLQKIDGASGSKVNIETSATVSSLPSVPDRIECWVYLLKHHRPQLLGLPHLETYHSKGSHGLPYAERYSRDPSVNIRSQAQNP